jgi:hypothetical protein
MSRASSLSLTTTSSWTCPKVRIIVVAEKGRLMSNSHAHKHMCLLSDLCTCRRERASPAKA